MIIEVKNVSDVNQGAHLMLRTIMAFRDNHIPDARIAVDMRCLRPETRRNYNLDLLTWSYFKSSSITGQVTNALSALIPAGHRQKASLVRDHEINIVLDAAGFMYSDQWGAAGAERMVLDMRRRQSRGVKYILLPQAFGPFKNQRTISAMREIGQHADLIFPRDSMSFEYLNEIGVNGDNIRQCPDMTFSLNPTDSAVDLPGDAAIIPNKRMLDKTSQEESGQYLNFLNQVALSLSTNGFKPFFLIHEKGDVELAGKVNETLTVPLAILTENDPVKLKSLVGKSALVVGSRFHGLVNALSQGVPALAAGWSHKYKMLFKDMGVEDHVFKLEDMVGFERRISELASVAERERLRNRLRSRSNELKAQCDEMWSQVLKCIQ